MSTVSERLDFDYPFCRRWIRRGGDVWAYVGADIRHVGDSRYGVPFTAYLAALQASRPSTSTGPLADGAASPANNEVGI